jgi:hypothetical protein
MMPVYRRAQPQRSGRRVRRRGDLGWGRMMYSRRRYKRMKVQESSEAARHARHSLRGRSAPQALPTVLCHVVSHQASTQILCIHLHHEVLRQISGSNDCRSVGWVTSGHTVGVASSPSGAARPQNILSPGRTGCVSLTHNNSLAVPNDKNNAEGDA